MISKHLYKEFIGKNVQVFTATDCFEGIIGYDDIYCVLVVSPTKKSTAKRFGPVTISGNVVTAIRLVYTVESEKYDDDCEDSCCETKE
ncbi:MAG TPA: hypothetical protein VII94_03965 [Candidatus Saccharimonadales bacterium]